MRLRPWLAIAHYRQSELNQLLTSSDKTTWVPTETTWVPMAEAMPVSAVSANTSAAASDWWYRDRVEQ
jgi:hypothetical protein